MTASTPLPAVELAEAMGVLSRTPPLPIVMLQDLPEGWIAADEGAGTFTPGDVPGHLIEGERVDWMVRVRRILEHGTSQRFEPFDRVAHRSAAGGRAMSDLLRAFERLRTANLAALRELALTGDDLARRGTHPTFGAVTLGELLATWVVHDLSHLAQIARVMAKRYRTAVGPWRAYLPILDR
jgi:hypothetical protein